jgi:hypothetical protein
MSSRGEALTSENDTMSTKVVELPGKPPMSFVDDDLYFTQAVSRSAKAATDVKTARDSTRLVGSEPIISFHGPVHSKQPGSNCWGLTPVNYGERLQE